MRNGRVNQRLSGCARRIGARFLVGVLLSLVLAAPAGCALGPFGQASVSGKVLGESVTAKEAGHVLPVPVNGADVSCDGATASTGPDGAFQLAVSSSSQYKCSVSAPGYSTLTATLAGASGDAISVTFSATGKSSCAANSHAALICPVLRLAPGTLSGIVTNPQTDSAASAVIVRCWNLDLSTWSGGQPPQAATATTDQSGRYILSLPVDPYGCLANDNAPLYHVAVAPAATTSADMETCDPHCPSFSYHNGTVMHSFTAYVIFWLPSGAALEPGGNNSRFESLVERYFRDIGGTPFYNILTQYWDKDGPISGAATFGGSFVDTTPYPHAGTQSDPLYDEDIQGTIHRDIQVNGWSDDQTHEIFVFTGYGIEECQSADSGASCTYTGGGSGFCGYHSALNNSIYVATYAYIADTAGCTDLPSFGQYPSPNHDATADAVLSTVSHEQFEAVSDPINGGWFDSSPYTGEMGDKCDTDFGTIHPDGSNVTLHGHPYIVQAEWSNASGSCAFALTDSP